MSRTSSARAAAALVGLLVTGGLATGATAQTTATASITATADVLGLAPLTAAGVNNLNFGSVTAGTTKAPTSMASDAGRFNISGEPSRPVTVTFALPSVLTGPGGSIPIAFSPTDGLHWTSYPATFVTFNPNAPFITALNGVGSLIIGIAGTVSPALGTTTGTYTGTVTMTVTY
jgi:spore coat protein U-like protein